jgi:GTP-binding protein
VVILAFSLANLQERGVLFVNPQTKVYKGMIVGEHILKKTIYV